MSTAPATEPAPVDNETVVVERSTPSVEPDGETVVVERSAPAVEPDGETVVVRREASREDENATIVVDRSPSPSAKGAPPAAPTRRGRRRITLPPVEPGFGAEPVEAAGPGATSSYAPRGIQPLPATAPEVPLGADATRAPAPSMPSVGKRSRTFGVIGVAGFALATTVSLVGLAAIVVSLLR